MNLPFTKGLKNDCKEIFPVVEYAHGTAPMYASGQMAFIIACKDPERSITAPIRKLTPKEEEEKYRYYNSEVHEASFVLPTFAKLEFE